MEDSPNQGIPEDAGRVPARRGLWSGLLLAFCCWHALFLVISIVPETPGRDETANPVLDLYRVAVGGRQKWNMFESIPTLHSLDVRLESEDENGNVTVVGPILPGFKPYPKPEDARYYVSFYRLVSVEPFRDAYLRKVARLLPPRPAPEAGGRWSLVVDAEYTRHLFHIKRDGQVSTLATKAFEVPASPGNPP